MITTSEKLIVHYSKSSSATKEFFRHAHAGYELIYVERGKTEIIVNNEQYVADSNSLIIISNLDEHRLKTLEHPYVRHVLLFDKKLTDEYITFPHLLAVFKNHNKDFQHVVKLDSADNVFLSLVNRLDKETSDKADMKNLYINLLAKQLFIELYRLLKNRLPVLQGAQFNTANKIQKYIDTNFQQKIIIADLSKAFFIDKYYMAHIFKKYVGVSVQQYLLLTRLNHAKYLLATTDLSISDVGIQCGFGDVNNFIRYFRREYSTTPQKFRKAAPGHGD